MRRGLLFLTFTAIAACGPQEEISQGAVPPEITPPKSAVPISGGNLLLASGGRFAVVSDPDEDKLWVVDLASSALSTHIDFPEGSEPSRMIEDADGHVRVVLRGAGQLATVSLTTSDIINTQSVCPAPRGVAFDSTSKDVKVACASGELVTLPDTGSMTSRFIRPDLRDVIIKNGRTFLTTFREAQLFDPDSASPPVQPTTITTRDGSQMSPGVAWRTVPTATGFITVHQREKLGDIAPPHTSAPTMPTSTTPPPQAAPSYGGSSGGCDTSVVHSAITTMTTGGQTSSFDLEGVLPVDIAISNDGNRIAVALPGSRTVATGSLSQIGRNSSCHSVPPAIPSNGETFFGEVVGVAFLPDNSLVVASRDPLQVMVLPAAGSITPLSPGVSATTVTPQGTPKRIALPRQVLDRVGHQLFHTAPKGIACASCHPEAGEDGHTWKIAGKQRRTMTLAGGILETAPFHWQGNLGSLGAVMTDTFVGRMGGKMPASSGTDALARLLERVPSPRMTAPEATAVDRGRDVFTSAGCAGCHAGPTLSTSANMDVGTGERLQVPSLRGVGLRSPLMHDGCAKTLEDRFNNPACGGTSHGSTSSLTPGQQADLISYLRTL